MDNNNINSQQQLFDCVSSTGVTAHTVESTGAVSQAQQVQTNVVTIPVPIVQNEGTFVYVVVKGSLHDYSCAVFGLDETEVQALSKRFDSGVKPVVNGVMVNVPPMVMVNTLAQLSYKIISSCGEAEISWTMQRET